MSTLYVVRHGQASFLAEDYDQLSERGVEQARRLGEYWLQNDVTIDEVYSGSLHRQRQTEASVRQIFQRAGKPWPSAEVLPGFDEYRADDFMEVLREELAENHQHIAQLSKAHARAREVGERYRTFHRLLAALMTFYIDEQYESNGFETWRQFHQRVTQALDHVRAQQGRGRRIAIFTSGGPVGVCTQTTLRAPEQVAGELNWRVYNASVTTFVFSAGRISLDQFNAIPHLPRHELRTYR